MIRTFVAVELDPRIRQAVIEVQSAVKERLIRTLRGVRIQWLRPEAIHLTLKFLGDIDEATLPDLERALAAVMRGMPRFSVQVGGVGAFPDERAPRVLWVGLTDPEQALARLARTVETALEPLGFLREGRPFSPHLTMARIKDRPREVGVALGRLNLQEQITPLGPLSVNGLSFMKSELKPTGAEYTRLFEIPLAG